MISDILKYASSEIGLKLSDENIKSFELFADELKKWNSRVNLTAITKDNEIAIKHFIDSLFLAPYVFDKDYVLDMGSGAGIPIIPLKIIKPETKMVSVDAVAKKVNFQRHVIRLLGLQGIEAVQARVEDLQETHRHRFSIITSRAFTRLDRFVSLAVPMLAAGGRLIAMKGADAGDEIADSHEKIEALGFAVTAIHHYALPRNMGEHMLVMLMARKPS